MRSELIFAPVAALALWTCIVLFWTGARRIWAVRTRQLKPSDFRMGDSPAVPARIAVMNRNLMNLLEMPVLFYVVCLAFFVTHHVTPALVGLAWCFVALRVVHSWIQISLGNILLRLVVFATSNLVLLGLWIWFVQSVLLAPS